jgi:uncharacterized membrane protein
MSDGGPSAAESASRRLARARRPAWVRLTAGVVVGVVAALVAPDRLGATMKIIAAWNAAALTMTAFAWSIIVGCGPSETRERAASTDPGRLAIGGFVILASALSILATGYALRGAKTCPVGSRDLFLGLGLLAVAAAWGLTHTIYALRYAHLYYRDGIEREGGLIFPGGGHPAYVDFAYYAFTVGMCFQVSDVTITNPRLRRETLAHAMLSFLYNTVVLAVALNFAIGTFG